MNNPRLVFYLRCNYNRSAEWSLFTIGNLVAHQVCVCATSRVRAEVLCHCIHALADKISASSKHMQMERMLCLHAHFENKLITELCSFCISLFCNMFSIDGSRPAFCNFLHWSPVCLIWWLDCCGFQLKHGAGRIGDHFHSELQKCKCNGTGYWWQWKGGNGLGKDKYVSMDPKVSLLYHPNPMKRQ